MKKTIICLLTFLLTVSITTNGQSISKDLFLTRWDSTAQYIKKLTATLPAEKLSFRPTDSVFTIREQLTHIYNHVNFIHTNFLSPSSELEDWNLPGCDLNCIEEKLDSSFKRIRKTVASMEENQLEKKHFFRPAHRELSVNEFLFLLLDHTRHHTGQLVIYLRLNGIKPPQYSGW